MIAEEFGANAEYVQGLLERFRTNPDLVVERTECVPLDLPPLSKVENRAGVLFRAEDVRLKAEQK